MVASSLAVESNTSSRLFIYVGGDIYRGRELIIINLVIYI